MCNEFATRSAHEAALCPHCHAGLGFRRSQTPNIDACGFESYRLDCRECGAALAGIIDPADDALLLTECEPQLKVALPQVAV
ncbi:MAG TPA: hypothetical protein VMB26_09095 [Candidatus Binataceae bacterium]|nr:hypothetical protein [Candidatus Binataceae bacterium]